MSNDDVRRDDAAEGERTGPSARTGTRAGDPPRAPSADRDRTLAILAALVSLAAVLVVGYLTYTPPLERTLREFETLEEETAALRERAATGGYTFTTSVEIQREMAAEEFNDLSEGKKRIFAEGYGLTEAQELLRCDGVEDRVRAGHTGDYDDELAVVKACNGLLTVLNEQLEEALPAMRARVRELRREARQ